MGSDKVQRKESKTIHEAFARFFESPTRETLRDLLKNNVGELRNCDFKETWPDHGSLSKHILGIANSGGGCLVFGVKENDDKTASSVGLETIVDKADITNGIKNFLPEDLLSTIEIGDYKYESSEYAHIAGKRFQVMFVHHVPDRLPFVSRRAGTGIRAAAIYIRREGVTEETSYEELQRLFKERFAASPQTHEAQGLKEHLEELKVLYAEVPRAQFSSAFMPFLSASLLNGFLGQASLNPSYPKEDYQQFVLRLIDAKRDLIEKLCGIK